MHSELILNLSRTCPELVPDCRKLGPDLSQTWTGLGGLILCPLQNKCENVKMFWYFMESQSRLASPGVRAGSVRGPFGIYSGSVRSPFGFRSGATQNLFRVRSRSVRDLFEGRTGSVRGPFGGRSGSVRGSCGVRLGAVRANFGPKISEPNIKKF